MEENKEDTNINRETIGSATISIKEFSEAEWCFQFDDDEPFVFSWSRTDSTPGELTFVIKPQDGSAIIFTAPGGKKFRLFAREMSDSTKKSRDNQESDLNTESI